MIFMNFKIFPQQSQYAKQHIEVYITLNDSHDAVDTEVQRKGLVEELWTRSVNSWEAWVNALRQIEKAIAIWVSREQLHMRMI